MCLEGVDSDCGADFTLVRSLPVRSLVDLLLLRDRDDRVEFMVSERVKPGLPLGFDPSLPMACLRGRQGEAVCRAGWVSCAAYEQNPCCSCCWCCRTAGV